MDPIFFVPFFEEKNWGGQNLSEMFKKYPADINIGESWEISPIRYRQTFVKDGPFEGMMLSDLYKTHRGLFGTKTEEFPFVIKLIDTKEMLPVSVNGGKMGNTQDQSMGWYIIKAEPDAKIVTGTEINNSYELFNAIAKESFEESLIFEDVADGDAFFVQSGHLNAIGKNTFLYQISSSNRETATIYDWGKSMESEIDKVIDTMVFNKNIQKTKEVPTSDFEILLISDDFYLSLIDADKETTFNASSVFSVYTALSSGTIEYHDGKKQYRAGDTFIIPALFGNYKLVGGKLLKAWL